jgi:hypothetical protein
MTALRRPLPRMTRRAAKTGPRTTTPAEDPASKTVTLLVRVTGAGRRVPSAEVQVKFPEARCDDQRHETNDTGETTFACDVSGPAKVRVVAPHWVTAFHEVELIAGSKSCPSIPLEPLGDGQ